MANLTAVLKQLERERGRLNDAIEVLRGLVGNHVRNSRSTRRVRRARRTMSAAARRRIIAAQKARWAKWRAQQKKAA